jgi:hypothetical protein
LLARALVEFYRNDGGQVVAFDLDAMDATLTQFLPECTVSAEIGETQSQVEPPSNSPTRQRARSLVTSLLRRSASPLHFGTWSRRLWTMRVT